MIDLIKAAAVNAGQIVWILCFFFFMFWLFPWMVWAVPAVFVLVFVMSVIFYNLERKGILPKNNS